MGKLADFFIEFSLKGLSTVQEGLAAVNTSLKGLQAGVDKVGATADSAFKKMTISLTAWVSAGVYASSAGALLGYQISELSRQIASVFLPVIQSVSEHLQILIDWFRSLSGEQQANLARWTEAIVVGLGFAALMPKVFAGITLVSGGIKMLATDFTILDVVTGGLLPAIGAVITGITALGIGAVVAGGGLGGLLEKFAPLFDALKRLQAVAGKALEPLIPVAERVINALVPVVAAAVDLAGAVAEGLVPVIALLAEEFEPVLLLMAPILKGFASLARLISAVVTPAIQAMTAQFAMLNRVLAWFVGVDLDKKISHPIGPQNKGSLLPPSKGFSSLEASWQRIAAASVGATLGRNIPKDQLETAQKQLAEEQAIRKALENIKPALGK